MKRCPQCYEAYEDEERFCEADGQELLADPTFSPPIVTVAAPPPAARAVWWPAAVVGILVGVVIGAGIFAAGSLMSAPQPDEPHATSRAVEPRENTPPAGPVVASNSVSEAPAEDSQSLEPEEEAAAQPSPVPTAENKAAAVQLNQGPISTGEKTKLNESDGGAQTVIEMNDGSSLDVDAAWEDKQGIWYRRSGLVSFVESSRVKAITARRASKVAEAANR